MYVQIHIHIHIHIHTVNLGYDATKRTEHFVVTNGCRCDPAVRYHGNSEGKERHVRIKHKPTGI